MFRPIGLSVLVLLLQFPDLLAQASSVAGARAGITAEAPLFSVREQMGVDRIAAHRSPPASLFRSTWLTEQGRRRKEPALAGLLSFVIPFGTGSFYAEHPGHGLRHLIIGGGMVAVGLAAYCAESCSESEETIIWVSIVGFTANWVAGTVTAVVDAGHFNRRQQPVRAGTSRFGVTLLHVSF